MVIVDLAGSAKVKLVGQELHTDQVFQKFRAEISRVLHDGGGTRHEWSGDGVLALFAEASQAVSAALLCQECLEALNTSANLSQRLLARVGVNTGEFYYDPGRTLGEFSSPIVDQAGHLQKDCPPGQVHVSHATTLLQVGGDASFDFVGINRDDVLVYRALPRGVKPAGHARAVAVGAPTGELRHSRHDATRMSRCLAECFGYEVAEPALTREAIEAALEDASGAQRLVLYLSGQVDLAGRGGPFFLLTGERARLDLNNLFESLSRARAETKLIILDCGYDSNESIFPSGWELEPPNGGSILSAGVLPSRVKEVDEYKASFLTYHLDVALREPPESALDQQFGVRLLPVWKALVERVQEAQEVLGRALPQPLLTSAKGAALTLGPHRGWEDAALVCRAIAAEKCCSPKDLPQLIPFLPGWRRDAAMVMLEKAGYIGELSGQLFITESGHDRFCKMAPGQH